MRLLIQSIVLFEHIFQVHTQLHILRLVHEVFHTIHVMFLNAYVHIMVVDALKALFLLEHLRNGCVFQR
jgi:hypothetical protein